MIEIKEVLTDSPGCFFDLVLLDNGTPKSKSFSLLELATHSLKPGQELVGIFASGIAAQIEVDRLKKGETIFLPD